MAENKHGNEESTWKRFWSCFLADGWKWCLLALAVLLVPVIFIWLLYRGQGCIATKISADAALSYCAEIISGGVFAGALVWWQQQKEKEHREAEMRPNIHIRLERRSTGAFDIHVWNVGKSPVASITLYGCAIADTLSPGNYKKVCVRINGENCHISETITELDEAIEKITPQTLSSQSILPAVKTLLHQQASSGKNDVDNAKCLGAQDNIDEKNENEIFPPSLELCYYNYKQRCGTQQFIHTRDGNYAPQTFSLNSGSKKRPLATPEEKPSKEEAVASK